jgi:hypothetical protein
LEHAASGKAKCFFDGASWGPSQNLVTMGRQFLSEDQQSVVVGEILDNVLIINGELGGAVDAEASEAELE